MSNPSTNTIIFTVFFTLFFLQTSSQPYFILECGLLRCDSNVVYSYADACRTQRHNEDKQHSLLEKYTSHFIWKCWVWEGVGDRTKTAIYWPPQPLQKSPCVVLVLLGCSSGDSVVQLSAQCWLSLTHLVTNVSDLQNSLTSCLSRVI